MNVSDKQERDRLTSRFRTLGFSGRVFDEGKRFSYSQTARRFVRKQMVLNKPEGLVPTGMIFDSSSGNIIKRREIFQDRKGKRKKGLSNRLQKRFTKLGIKFDKRTRATIPSAQQPSIMKADVKVKIKRYEGRGRTREFEDTITINIPFRFGSGNLPAQAGDDIRRIVNERYGDSGIEIVSMRTTDTEYLPRPNARGVPLDSIRLQKVFLRIDGMQEQKWDTKQNKCVIDFLHYYYDDDKNVNDDLLTTECFNECFEENWETEGVSTIEIGNWCKFAQVRMIALDADRKVIRKYEPHSPCKAKVLIFIIKNKHIHPVLDHTEIKSISKITSKSNEMTIGKKSRVKKIIEDEKQKEEKLPVEVIDSKKKCGNSNFYYLCKTMLDRGVDVLHKKVKWGKSGPESFVLDGVKYVFHNHKTQDAIKDFLEKNNMKYTGQKPSKYVYKAMNEFKIKSSYCNEILSEMFSMSAIKRKTHKGGKICETSKYRDMETQEMNWDLYPEPVVSLDINKCHTSILMKPLEKWLLFNFTAQVENYFHLSDRILPGLYFIETKDRKLFQGNKWYSSSIVAFGMSEKIITKDNIKKQVIATDTLSKNYFVGLLDEYKKQLNGLENTDEGKSFIKQLNNTTTGILGKTHFNRVDKFITTDEEQMYDFMIENHAEEGLFYDKQDVKHNDEKHTFFVYGKKTRVNNHKNNFAMYIQILDQQAIKMYKFINAITNNNWDKVLYRNIDCFTIIDDHQIKYKQYISNEVGMLKIIDNPQYPIEQEYVDVDIDWSKYKKEWKPYNDIKTSNDYETYFDLIKNKTSLMTKGEAGLGKSYIIGKLRDQFKCLCLAYTNVAALRIKGQTIHSAFKFDEEAQTISSATLRKMKKEDFDVIIIDEDEIIPGNLWRVLYEVKKTLKVPFLMFGDWKQLKSMDGYENYENHDIVKSLCDYNVSTLEYHSKCRMDKKLRALSLVLREGGCFHKQILPFLDTLHDIRSLPMINICYSNYYRRDLNDKMNAIHSDNYDNYKIPDRMKDIIIRYFPDIAQIGKDNEFEVFTIHKQQPVISLRNDRVKDIYNGQRYIVENIIREETKYNTDIDFDDNNQVRKLWIDLNGEPKKTKTINSMKKELVENTLYKNIRIVLRLCEDDTIKEVSLMTFCLLFDMAYCMTNHKIIGDTIKTDFCIHQTDFKYVDNEWLYTTISRAKTKIQVKIFYPQKKYYVYDDESDSDDEYTSEDDYDNYISSDSEDESDIECVCVYDDESDSEYEYDE